MDGYTATREIRRNPARVALPIFAMTANAMVGDRERVLAAGMNDHIAKPLQIGAMFATIAHWMGRSAGCCPNHASAGSCGCRRHAAAPALPRIDTAAGLAVTQNNAALYRRLLVKFRDSQRGTLRTSPRHVPPATCPSQRASPTACAAAPATSARTASARRPGPWRWPAAGRCRRRPSTAQRLKQQLEKGDSDATETAQELLAAARGSPVESRVIKIAAAVSDFDFDASLRLIESLA